MLNIIKYDWMKRWKFFVSGIILFLYVNFSMWNGHTNSVSVMLTIALGVMVIGLVIDQVGRIYNVLYSDEGMLVFSAPMSGFKLLAAKLIAVVLECIGVLAVISITSYVNFSIFYEQMGFQSGVIMFANEDIVRLLPTVINITAFLLVGYIAWILIFHLATILTKSVFSFVKYGKLLTVVLFLLLNEITLRVIDVIGIVHNYNTAIGIQEWSILLMLVAIYYGASGYLLDRKLNL